MSDMLGLYIHIPFCRQKCLYCDFFSGKAIESDYDYYVAELKNKIKYWSKKTNRALTSVYFGGGTPSVMGTNRLCDVLDSIKENFEIDNNAEITLEVNPESGNLLNYKALKKRGVNRISIGMQSADENELKVLGRIHSLDDVKRTVKSVNESGINNISLDLMLGIPFQTFDSLKKSIDFCARLGVNHISSYILKIEEGTPFYKIQNELALPDEDTQSELYLFAVDYLDKLGYKQYEISNFAKTGFESRHNTSYWKLDEYIGIGPSAHSFFDGRRFFYGRNMQDFAENKLTYDGNGGDEEEFIMLSLRLKSGLDFELYKEKFGKPIPGCIIEKIENYVKYGLMEKGKNSVSFTPKGFLVSNVIISELI